MTSKSFYEEIFEDMGEEFFSRQRAKEQVSFFLSLVPLKKDDLILDMGAGIGLHVDILNKKNIKAIGVEFSKTFVEKAKEIHGKEVVFQGDMRCIENKYDVITFFDSSFGMFDDRENKKLLEKCFHHLNKDGTIFIDYLNPLWWENQTEPHILNPYMKKGQSLKRTYSYDKETFLLTDTCEIYQGKNKVREYQKQRLKLYPPLILQEMLGMTGFKNIWFYGSRNWKYKTSNASFGPDSAFLMAVAQK